VFIDLMIFKAYARLQLTM